MDDAGRSSRAEIFERDGMLRANADAAAVAELYRSVRCDLAVGNDCALAGWAGAPSQPFSHAVRRAPLVRAHLALIAAILYRSAATRSIRDCAGGPFIVASARVFSTPPHAAEDSGLGPLFVPSPPGVVRTITFLHDLDHTSSPFEMRVHTQVLTPSTPRGTVIIFDPARVHWKERPPLRGARVVLDAVCIARADLPPQVWASGMNYWPLDPAAPPPEVPIFLLE